MNTFLSVYTPTYKRPLMLAQCVASIAAQTEPVEHVIVHDEVGVGIGGVYKAMPDHCKEVHGDYVMVLSDDNVLEYDNFAWDLRQETERAGNPQVVVFKGRIEETVQPLGWETEPVVGAIDLSCFAVQRGIWCKHADHWGNRYEGDFDFIHYLWYLRYRFHWWDRLCFHALQISRGLPE